jgi:hypothetical protein
LGAECFNGHRWECNYLIFNADSKTVIEVDVEGIADPGIPLAGRARLQVK